MKEKICIICKQTYVARANNQKCCSKTCAALWTKEKTKRNFLKSKASSRRDGICVVCDKFFNYHFRGDRGERKFCSRSCASKFYIKDGTFDTWRTRKNELQDRYVVNCIVCGAEKLVLKRVLEEHEKFDMVHCCDGQCRGKYTQEIFTGRFRQSPTEETRKKQLATMMSRYGVTNAFMLAKHRTKSKPQIAIHDWLMTNFADFNFEIEKLICKEPKEIFVDIVSKTHNLVIEFNGDFWHCNPSKYEPDYMHPVKEQTALEIWSCDSYRKNLIEQANYSVYTIWESEYNKDVWKDDLTRWVLNNAKKENIDD